MMSELRWTLLIVGVVFIAASRVGAASARARGAAASAAAAHDWRARERHGCGAAGAA